MIYKNNYLLKFSKWTSKVYLHRVGHQLASIVKNHKPYKRDTYHTLPKVIKLKFLITKNEKKKKKFFSKNREIYKLIY